MNKLNIFNTAFNFKKAFWRGIAISSLLAIGCAKGRFQTFSTAHCSSDTKVCDIDETIHVSGGMVDILFVDDNSGSMSFEQSKMGLRLNSLLEKLDERMLDYRIAITTTDISSPSNPPRDINQKGALQDGALIAFSNGMSFLEPNTANKQSQFLDQIQRKETAECENFINTSRTNGLSQQSQEYQLGYYNHCPSGDERGIYAALKVVTNNPKKFIRAKSHLAVIVLSDENERSWASSDANNPYKVTTEDDPSNFINTFNSKYPNQTLGVHSIVIQSGDTACLNAQNAQMSGVVNGQYGTFYETLSKGTNGIIGSVCAPDYADQMGRIGAAIVKQVQHFGLHCEKPENLQIFFIPTTAATGYHVEGRRVVFDTILDPSSKVRFVYKCPIVE